MPIPTPMPIEAPVERLELALGGVDVEVGDEVDEVLEEGVVVYIKLDVEKGITVAIIALVDNMEEEVEDDDEPELELETLMSNKNTGKLSVWPSVAFGLLLQAALIVSRTIFSAWLERP
jgi:hypothetical protein